LKPNRRLQFHKRGQDFIGTHDETLSVAMYVYEVRTRKDKRGVDLISDVLPFGPAVHHKIALESFLIADGK